MRALRFDLVAAGSGVTPFLQLLQDIYVDCWQGRGDGSGAGTSVRLVYSVRSEAGIIQRSLLDKLAGNGITDMKVHYCCSSLQRGDRGKGKAAEGLGKNVSISRGRVSASVLEERLHDSSAAAEEERVALVCGPDAFAAAAVEMLRAAGRARVIVL